MPQIVSLPYLQLAGREVFHCLSAVPSFEAQRYYFRICCANDWDNWYFFCVSYRAACQVNVLLIIVVGFSLSSVSFVSMVLLINY